MADKRSKRQKLQAMANQSVSPKEAEIAKKKLSELGEESPPNFGNLIMFYNGDNLDFSISITVQEAIDKALDGAWVYNFKTEEWVKY